MEQISNTHTGYIHKLITNLSFYFFEMIWQFEISVIPLIIGGTSILIIFCNDKIMENSEEYLKVTKLNERKRSNANGVFTGLMDSLYCKYNNYGFKWRGWITIFVILFICNRKIIF